MNDENPSIEVDLESLADELDQVVRADHSARAFWQSLLAGYCRLAGSSQALILVRRGDEEDWRPAAEYPPANAAGGKKLNREHPPLSPTEFRKLAPKAAELVTENSRTPVPVHGNGHCLAGIRLRLLGTQDICVAVFVFAAGDDHRIQSAIGQVHLVSAAPRAHQLEQAVRHSKREAEKFARVCDLLLLVNEEDRFLAAALSLCNHLCNVLECERVSLAWQENGYAKLKAISRMEKFDRQMQAAQAIEAAMDETLDQDEAVMWPAPDGQTAIARAHRALSQSQEAISLVSLPLHRDEEIVSVVLCERQDRGFTEVEVQQLRLACDLATPRLIDLKQRDRWFGARWLAGGKAFMRRLLGPDHTWAKVLSIAGVLLLAALILVKVDYRVEGDFILRSKEVVYLTAPYNGYIDEAQHEAGDLVREGDLLLTLQTDELLLQEAAELADVASYARQSERARASNQLAEMRIADARRQQSEARLAIVRHRLAQAEVRAPFAGVIIEGDLRELRGKPLQQGNPLFKLAKLEGMYVEVDIEERDVHEILASETGEIAFVSRPRLKFPMSVTALESAAFPKEEQNVFKLRGEPVSEREPWWRPGMTGVCKVDVEKRSLLWIVGHRTVDFLRMWLWW